MTSLLCRRVHPEDYPPLERLYREEGSAVTAAALRRADEERRPSGGRWVALFAGRAVAHLVYLQSPDMAHEGHYQTHGFVAAATRGRGVGSALLAAYVGAIRPRALAAVVEAENVAARRFLENRGFAVALEEHPYRLNLASVDFSRLPELERRLARDGVALRALAGLGRGGDPTAALLDLYNEVQRDVPREWPYTPVSLERFREDILGQPWLDPEAYFVAVADGRFVGTASVSRGDETVESGLLGVRPAYRGHGLARALKLRALLHAAHRGTRWALTLTASSNAAALALNTEFGYVRDGEGTVSLVWRA